MVSGLNRSNIRSTPLAGPFPGLWLAPIAGLAFPAAFIGLPLALFLVIFHWQVLLPTNVSWLLQGDWGAHAVGWNAFRHDAWRWPLGATQLLAWPTGATLTFTDSNPLASLLFKPFAGLLPEPFQFTGLWFLACVFLQFGLGFELVRRDARSRWLALGGALLLTLLPALINRIGHASLFAHWTILLALHLFIDVERSPRRDLFYALTLAASALIHPYLLMMNASIWGSDVLRSGALLARARDWRGFGAFAARSAAVAAATVGAFWLVGGLQGGKATVGGFGHYSMALDALFNPGRDEFSTFFGAPPQGAGQVFEGFQYLGAGLLLLAACAAAAVVLSGQARARLLRMSWLAWLAPAMIALSLFALSASVQLHGREVLRLPLDLLPADLTDAVRASGRFFWPCAYLIVLVSLKLIFALRLRWSFAVVAAALALQTADLVLLVAVTRIQTAAARDQPILYQRTPDPRWDELVRAAQVVEFHPPDPQRDERLFYELAWRASSLGRPVNVMYTARPDRGQKALEAEARRALLNGAVRPDRLYVLSDLCPPPGAAASRVRMLDGAPVIPPASAGSSLPPAPAPSPAPMGRDIRIVGEPAGACLLGAGWSRPEGWGAWSDGDAPELLVRLAGVPSGDLIVTLTARSFPPSGQTVTVRAAGRPIGRLALTGDPRAHSIRVPADAMAGGLLRLTLQVERPQSPKALGFSPDERRLGVGIESVRIDPAG